MADIVLSTLNAKYIHTAFGLRYLLANLGGIRPQASLVEFDINQRPLEIAEALLAHKPNIVGFGVYIWNVTETTELIAILKRLQPNLIVILGGPEVSYEYENQAIVDLADFVITGEADLEFAKLCMALQQGARPREKIIHAGYPNLENLHLPYAEYADPDIQNRIVYVEASRGCPFGCEFCLSSLDIPVRAFPLDAFLVEMQRLLDRGLKHFKFVDRTFNLDLQTSRTILEFFLARYQPGQLFHFELIPDRLPESLRAIISQFPPGALQFEIGLQTFHPDAAARINRRQDYLRVVENFNFLRRRTGVHLHADLIAGLPGEDLASFAAGFDRLMALAPQEIQVGILKRLRGTALARHTEEWGMRYNPNPPYDLLANDLIPFTEMQRLRRFARFWDLVGNSGNFVETTPLIWSGVPSPFTGFMRFCDFLYLQVGRTDSIALPRLMEWVFNFLTQERGLPCPNTALALLHDYKRSARRDVPGFLQPFLPASVITEVRTRENNALRRQARHLPIVSPPAQ